MAKQGFRVIKVIYFLQIILNFTCKFQKNMIEYTKILGRKPKGAPLVLGIALQYLKPIKNKLSSVRVISEILIFLVFLCNLTYVLLCVTHDGMIAHDYIIFSKKYVL